MEELKLVKEAPEVTLQCLIWVRRTAELISNASKEHRAEKHATYALAILLRAARAIQISWLAGLKKGGAYFIQILSEQQQNQSSKNQQCGIFCIP